jgi:hypothetical protein
VDATDDPSDTVDFVPITPQGGNISAIAVNPKDANKVAYATSTGEIYYTENALAPVTTSNMCKAAGGSLAQLCADAGVNGSWSGADVCTKPYANSYDTSSFCDYVSGVTWKRLDVSGTTRVLPNRWVSSLTFDTSGRLYVTFSGFSENTPQFPGHVFATGAPGAASVAWSNLDGTQSHHVLPDIPANKLVVRSTGTLIVAADYGVFASADGGVSWKRQDYGMSNAPVYDLALSPDESTLYAATHGRGIWKAPAP